MLIVVINHSSDYADQVWIWENEDGSVFYFDVGEVVRFRVETEDWHDQIPNAPDLGDGSTAERRPPYSIMVCPERHLRPVTYANPLRARCKWPGWGLLRGGDFVAIHYGNNEEIRMTRFIRLSGE